MAYKIIRFFRRPDSFDERSEWKRTIKSGLTLEEARAHCHDPETHSSTAKGPLSRSIQRRHGPSIQWFDGYEEVK